MDTQACSVRSYRSSPLDQLKGGSSLSLPFLSPDFPITFPITLQTTCISTLYSTVHIMYSVYTCTCTCIYTVKCTCTCIIILYKCKMYMYIHVHVHVHVQGSPNEMVLTAISSDQSHKHRAISCLFTYSHTETHIHVLHTQYGYRTCPQSHSPQNNYARQIDKWFYKLLVEDGTVAATDSNWCRHHLRFPDFSADELERQVPRHNVISGGLGVANQGTQPAPIPQRGLWGGGRGRGTLLRGGQSAIAGQQQEPHR